MFVNPGQNHAGSRILLWLMIVYALSFLIGFSNGWNPYLTLRNYIASRNLWQQQRTIARIKTNELTSSSADESMINTTQRHNQFMDLAMKQARKAERKGEVPIGAVVVERRQDGSFRVLSQAYNSMESSMDASAHAELLALQRAAKRVHNWRLLNATLYSTLEPCPMCLAAAQAFRVSGLVYGAPDLRLGAVETHMRLLDDYLHPSHRIEHVISGVMREESADLMRSFFRKRRKQPEKSQNKIGFGSKLSSMHSTVKRKLGKFFCYVRKDDEHY